MNAKYIYSRSRGNAVYPRLVITVVTLCCVATMSPELQAQVAENNILEDTLNTYETRMSVITGNISGLLVNTFYLLALVEFIWGMIKTYIDNGGLQTFLTEIVTRIMFIGFFLYLFRNGTQFPLDIVNTFRDLAATTPGTGRAISPDNVIDIGQNFLSQSWDEIRGGNILSGLGMMFAAIIVFVAMVILAAHLTVALLEFFVVGYGGFVLLAFGASRWTHGYAVSYLKYAMSVGMKLFILLIIIAVIQVEMTAYLTTVDQASMTNVWAVTAFALFSVVLAVIAPQSVMGMMSGVSIASGAGAAAAGGALYGAGRAATGAVAGGAGAVAGAATSVMGAATAASSAAKLGRAAASASGGGAASSALAGTGAVAKELATAGGSGLARAFPVKESAGGKLAARMNSARNAIDGD